MHVDPETRELEQPWRYGGLPTDERLRLLLDAMTAQNQIALGIADFASVAHLAVPALVYTDGGNGVRDAEGTTAFPVTLALAAAFDSHLAFSYGAAIGSEVRSVGRNVLLGPAIDIARTPLAGRLPEAFGEDPWLAGELASGHVRGVQSHPVVCMVKHLVANNFETDRTGEGPPGHRRDAVDVRVPSRALHQVYLKPFKKVLLGAGAWSVMGSYNRLNGVYPCQSPDPA